MHGAGQNVCTAFYRLETLLKMLLPHCYRKNRTQILHDQNVRLLSLGEMIITKIKDFTEHLLCRILC